MNIGVDFEIPQEFTQCSFLELLGQIPPVGDEHAMNDQAVMHNFVVNDNDVRDGNGVGNNEEESSFDIEGDENAETEAANNKPPIEAEEGVPGFLFEDLELSDEESLFDDTDDQRSNKVKLSLLKKKVSELMGIRNEGKKKNSVANDKCNGDTKDAFSDVEDEDMSCLDDKKCLEFRSDSEMEKFILEPTLKFKNGNEFRLVIKDYSVRHGIQLEFTKNDRNRVVVKCQTCNNWRVRASWVQGGPTFQIKTMTCPHTHCAWRFDNTAATYKYLGHRIKQHVKDVPVEPLQNLADWIFSNIKVNCSVHKAQRARREAFRLIHGDAGVQYTKLWDYCATMMKHNPGAYIKIGCHLNKDNVPVLEKMFFTYDALISGFLAGCRPIIGIDGCFLKTPFGGQLLCAVARDENDNMFPIAFAIVPVENHSSWSWFLHHLHTVIGDPVEKGICYISDRQKGLLQVFQMEYPHVHHRFCVRHMYENFRKKWSSLELKELFWKAASATTEEEFDTLMNEIKEIDPKIGERQTSFEWLSAIPAVHWSRCKFPTHVKCDALTNNISESCNSYLLEARGLPIISMCENIRSKLMCRIHVKKSGIQTYSRSMICPNIKRKMRKMMDHAVNWSVMPAGLEEFQGMRDNVTHVVKLSTKECTCRKYQLTGVPCLHALAVCYRFRYNEDLYVDKYFHVTTFTEAYGNVIHPVPGPHAYVKTPYTQLLPPVVKRKCGRPKKNRRKSPQEEEYARQSTRKGLTVTCANCGERGHNKRSCKKEPHQHANPRKRGRPRKNDREAEAQNQRRTSHIFPYDIMPSQQSIQGSTSR